jgi:deoxycytidine triphosphate deaminase
MLQSILSTEGIEQLLELGLVKLPEPRNIQPAGLDFRIGKAIVFDEEAQRKGARYWNKRKSQPGTFGKVIDEDVPDTFGTVIEDEDVLVPPNSHVEIFPKGLHVDSSVTFFFDLRSSYGRLGFRPYRYIPEYNEGGSPYIAMRNNNPNPILFPKNDRFAQGFFEHPSLMQHAGQPVLDENLARDIVKELGADNVELDGPFVVIHAGDKARRFKRDLRVIDKSNAYSDEELYIVEDISSPFTLDPSFCSVISSKERFSLSNKIGLLLCRSLPPSGDMNIDIITTRVNAGWVDPGYEGKITMTPFDPVRPITICKGMPIAYGLMYFFPNGCKNVYGECGNRYQNSKGVGFKP